jgi:hypothetical protein
MSERPVFLSVSYSGSGLDTMSYEKRMVREKDVKFDGEDGTLELTDIRLVWYKKPSKWGGLKKVGALAGAVAGAAIMEGIGREVGGIGGRAIRRAGRGMGYAAVGLAISSWTRDSYYNKDKNGNTESIALPILAINQAQQTGKELVVELKSGGDMRFNFKQKKVIPSVIANITSAQEKGKCPYCGSNTGNAAQCPKCGAPIEGGGSPSAGAGDAAGYCMNCGAPYPAGAKFCNKCGQKVS